MADEWRLLAYEWDDAGNEWIPIDSLFLNFYNSEDSLNYVINVNSIHGKYRLVSDGEHLFSFGKRSYPKVYMGDYGEPYGNIPKGWRSIVGDVSKGHRLPTLVIYGGDVIDGELYAVSYEGLYKISLKNLNSIIAGEKDFF